MAADNADAPLNMLWSLHESATGMCVRASEELRMLVERIRVREWADPAKLVAVGKPKPSVVEEIKRVAAQGAAIIETAGGDERVREEHVTDAERQLLEKLRACVENGEAWEKRAKAVGGRRRRREPQAAGGFGEARRRGAKNSRGVDALQGALRRERRRAVVGREGAAVPQGEAAHAAGRERAAADARARGASDSRRREVFRLRQGARRARGTRRGRQGVGRARGGGWSTTGARTARSRSSSSS